jgi:hypothetical protein
MYCTINTDIISYILAYIQDKDAFVLELVDMVNHATLQKDDFEFNRFLLKKKAEADIIKEYLDVREQLIAAELFKTAYF